MVLLHSASPQPSFDPYIPGTCPELLKFKFAEHNSVDFLLDVSAADKGGLNLDLSLAARGRLVLQPQLRNKIVFPAGENPMTYHHRIVECRWSMCVPPVPYCFGSFLV